MQKKFYVIILALILGLVGFYYNYINQAENQEIVQSENTHYSSTRLSIPDFIQPNIQGESVSVLGEVMKNKITILDFWASWCPPCIREIPNLKMIYDGYKNKGLGIISISLDIDKQNWEKAIFQYKMPWLHLSELKGWESNFVHLFNIKAIPYIIIVDSNGVILATDLRGQTLANYIEELLK